MADPCQLGNWGRLDKAYRLTTPPLPWRKPLSNQEDSELPLTMQDHTRDPCPWVILNDFGGAFSMGVILASSSLLCFQLEFGNDLLQIVCRWRNMAWHQRLPELSLGIAPLWISNGGAIANDRSKGERRIGALTAIKARAPVLGGNFGVWGGLFSTFDCAVKGVRKKEDPYNASMHG